MKTFNAFLALEGKRFFSMRNRVVMLAFLVLCLGVLYLGILQYRDLEKRKAEFLDVIQQKTENFQNYQQYAGYGIRLYYMPGPLNPLFANSGLFSELTGEFDQGEKLNIFSLLKGKNIFAEKPGKLIDFSGLFLFLGSLMALYSGYEAFRSREYLRFLASLFGYRRVFVFLWLSRAIWLIFYFTAMLLCAVLLLLLSGINIPGTTGFLLAFLVIKLMLMIFFFSLGCLANSLGERNARYFLMLAWFLFVYLLPVFTNKIIEATSRNIAPNTQSELTKLNDLMAYERWFADEGRRTNPIDATLNYQNYYAKIRAEEDKSASQISRYIHLRQYVSIISPSTFYLSVTGELGSQGYRGIDGFYKKERELKNGFIDFYIKKRIEEKKNALQKKTSPQVESFRDLNEYIFTGQSRIPKGFFWGVLITLLYIGLSAGLAYLFYIQYLFSIPEENLQGLEGLEIEINERVSNAVLGRGVALKSHLYNVLSGRSKKFPGIVAVNNERIGTSSSKIDFVYLFRPKEIPTDIRVKDLLAFVGRISGISKDVLNELISRLDIKEKTEDNISDLPIETQGKILLEIILLTQKPVYMFYDFARYMPADFLKDFIDRLKQVKEQGASILYLTNDIFLARKIGDYVMVLKQDAGLMLVNI